MGKRVLSSAAIVSFIAAIALSIIAYSRGYRFNLKQKNLTSTGILSVSSYPDKASVFLDGKLTSASNASLSLAPGWYRIRLNKEGYQSWEKRIRIQGEVVSQIDALLIPNNSSLRALTSSGVFLPTLSPLSSKTAYIVLPAEATLSSSIKNGLFILELRSGPLGGKVEPRQIFTGSGYDWKNARLMWSPDEKEIILSFVKKEKNKETVTSALLLLTDSYNPAPVNIFSTLPVIQSEWKKRQEENSALFLSSLPPALSSFLSEKTTLIKPSPDETKILYLATSSATLEPVVTPPLIGSNPTVESRTVSPKKFFVYDIKEDKNFFIVDEGSVAKADSVFWYTDSKHIVMIEKGTIYIVDYDGTNKRPVYSGPLEDNVVFPWTPGGKLVILTNLNKPQALPNLYEVDLR